MKQYDIIRYPVFTEKSNAATSIGKYTFIVAEDSTKPEIKDAVEKLFGVKVTKVNVMNNKAKNVVFRGRRGKTSASKKAIVTLASGLSIDLTKGIN